MNKTIIIAGGASVASLAIGGAGGYFLAKKKFDETVEARVQKEVDATKKFYSVLLMEAREKPAEVPDVEEGAPEDEEEELGDEPDPDLEQLDDPLRGAQPDTTTVVGKAKAAMIDYRGYGENGVSNGEVTTSNVFDRDKPKKQLPPREPGTGKFLPKTAVEQAQSEDGGNQPPAIITHEDFLLNEEEYDQENLTYFINDKTLLGYDPESPIDTAVVGEVNLTLFPEVPEGEPSIICVRNHGLRMDYEIKLATESLTEYMGLGESESDFNDNDPADEANQAAYL